MKITNENLVSTFRASEQTQEAFCKDQGISIERLRYYLYKKNPNKTKPRKQPVKKSTTPAFISFNAQPSSSKIVNDSTCSYTILHGAFTQNQLVSLIKALGH